MTPRLGTGSHGRLELLQLHLRVSVRHHFHLSTVYGLALLHDVVETSGPRYVRPLVPLVRGAEWRTGNTRPDFVHLSC